MSWFSDAHFMWLMFFWALLATAVVFGMRYAFVDPWHNPKLPETPEQALKRHFKAGEIDRDEYQMRLRALREVERKAEDEEQPGSSAE